MSQTPDTIDPLFKLKNSPLQGVEAYRSPFYRRLLSAGYKGYIQGSLGGATLFAALGAIAGGVVALGGAALFPTAAATAFLAVPIMAVGGLMYGKDSFGQIGAMAAISAEQAEMNEKRRSLLDRYYETPSKEEAKAIEEMLQDQSEEKMPKKWFHWKAALLGAVVVGTAAALIFSMPIAVSTFAPSAMEALTIIGKKVIGETLLSYALSNAIPTIAAAASTGALVGSLVGIDRAYIRKWFDVQEHFHDDTHTSARKIEHQQSVERLQQAYRREGYGLEARGGANEVNAREGSLGQIKPVSPRTVSDNTQQETPIAPPAAEKPKTTVQAKEASVSALVENMRAPVASL